MSSKVYFIDFRADVQNNFMAKLERMVQTAGVAGGAKPRQALPVYGKHFESACTGKEIVQADALISVAHFKGHELSGFGGATNLADSVLTINTGAGGTMPRHWAWARGPMS